MKTPFNLTQFQYLMRASEASLLIANSRHNIRYLTGGYYYHFHMYSDRMGLSRYIPFVGIPIEKIENSFFIGRKEERESFRATGVWIPNFVECLRGVATATEALIGMIRKLGMEKEVLAVELPFLPADAFAMLRSQLPQATFIDATPILNELRTIKTFEEQQIMRIAYQKVANCILRTFQQCHEGISTLEIETILKKEMAQEGVSFLFALICAGPGFSRAPSPHIRWNKGEVLHIDAGGEIQDYVADICRMGNLGIPSPIAIDLHKACLEVQNQVREIVRPGLPCSALIEKGYQIIAQFPFAPYSRFVVHGIGMVPYEPPECSLETYRPLEAGMVLSIETDFLYPGVGNIKIEDAVLVTESGQEGLGDAGRDFQIIP